MATQSPESITKYDVLFAVRTGVTVLMQKHPVFDGGHEVKAEFRISPENPEDVLITADGKSAKLKGFRKDYLEEAIERGVMMFYEMKDDEVVRCTPCNLGKN